MKTLPGKGLSNAQTQSSKGNTPGYTEQGGKCDRGRRMNPLKGGQLPSSTVKQTRNSLTTKR